ncbi:DUF975 family protein [Carnobacterium sp.]|uniref:DUF975 family protein n=1 Tax=Carnobacterium sp. TaxID=48221 RepID=UPI003890EB07
MDRKYIKGLARDTLKQHFFIIVLVTIVPNILDIYGVLSEDDSSIFTSFIVSLIVSILVSSLSPFIDTIILKLNRHEAVSFQKDIAEAVKNHSTRYILTMWLREISILFWSLFLIIPGIYKSYSYSLVSYLLVDNEDISYKEALSKSEELMEGFKMDWFIMDLSFLLWDILALFTFGIPYIWLTPYKWTVYAKFYDERMKLLANVNVSIA